MPPTERPADERDDGTLVYVEPAGITLEVRPGETPLQAAWRAGYHWPTLCYGMGTCTTCQCEILEGGHLASPRTEAEDRMLGDLNRRVRRVNPRRVRLACQFTVSGDIRVRKPGVKLDPNVATVETEQGSNHG